MKKIFLIGVTVLAFAACNNSNTSNTAVSADTSASTAAAADTTNAPVISFDTPTYDFGTVTAGEKVSYKYKFKNTGKSPLIISNALASCGCTVPDYPRQPIAPGEEGEISVIFDSAGKAGQVQDKVITLTSNALPNTTQLHLTGKVN